MKRFLLLNCALCIVHCASSQTPGEWTWMSGDSSIANSAVFGTQGVPAVTNKPPGLYEACEWTDQTGNFWLYGGKDNGGTANYGDMWRYNPSTNEWTWMTGTGVTNAPANYGTMGVAAPTNTPGMRGWGSATWVDNNNNLWMFGGLTSFATTNDLWMYNIATNMWTWMRGPNITNDVGTFGTQGVSSPLNNPPARAECNASWTDAGNNLWVFGGYSLNTGSCWEDLWKYSIATNEWTWMNGSSTPNLLPVYGVKGVSAPANSPGGRLCYSKFKDLQNNFWIFGGGTSSDARNDLWKYNPTINEWTWMSGTNVTLDFGNYTSYCIADSNFIPRSSTENRACWTDACGNFWTFGSCSELSFGTSRNDLWTYNTTTNRWTWISGAQAQAQNGDHGTIGVSAPTNVPGSKSGALPFMDLSGNLWLFGGTNQLWTSTYNDMWRYVPDPACGGSACGTNPVINFSASDRFICPGTCIDFINFTVNATSYQWSFPGAVPSASTDANPTFICYNTPGNYDVTLIATNTTTSDTVTLVNLIHVFPQPAIPLITQIGNDLHATSGYVTYQWFFGSDSIAGATDSIYTATQSGNYNLVVTDTNGCAVGAGIVNVEVSVGVKEFTMHDAQFTIHPNPARENISVRMFNAQCSMFNVEIYNSLGEKVYSTTMNNRKEETINCKGFAGGIYIVCVRMDVVVGSRKFVVER